MLTASSLHRNLLALTALLPLALGLRGISGCSSSTGNGFGDEDGGSGTDGGGGSTSGGLTGSDAGSKDGGNVSSGPAEVFGQSDATLYKLDPDTKAITTIGNFKGADDSIIDIALDAAGNMFGVTGSTLYRIDKTNANCTKVASGGFPNSLSFVPAGTLDPSVEALVGYEGANYVRIDPQTGVKSVIKANALPNGLQSSGDVVSVKDGPTYLTARGTGCSASDCLLLIDPKTGAMIKNEGLVGYSNVFGLAFWAGTIYGFNDAGTLFSLTLSGGIKSTKITIPNAPAGLSFYGAGSTTSAPVGPK
ncbi:MAG: hypothetical protein U0174_05075 [Polyangiaceae bacterium]